jgi:hypothetical protein
MRQLGVVFLLTLLLPFSADEKPRITDFEISMAPGFTILYNDQLTFVLSVAELQFVWFYAFQELRIFYQPVYITLRQRSKVYPLGISLDLQSGLSLFLTPFSGEKIFLETGF